MPEEQLPQPIPLSAGPLNPNRPMPAPESRPQCRALTTDGHRCKNKVLDGLHLCFSHFRNRRPALPPPRYVTVPLLEDHSAIQLMTTQILHGILSKHLDPLSARAALYALHIAALTLPRPARAAAPAPSATAQPQAADPSVCHIGRDHEDFISADGDLSEPPLNPCCSVPESASAARELLQTFEPENCCYPEDAPIDMPPVDLSHGEHCRCPSCKEHQRRIAELTQDIHNGDFWTENQPWNPQPEQPPSNPSLAPVTPTAPQVPERGSPEKKPAYTFVEPGQVVPNHDDDEFLHEF